MIIELRTDLTTHQFTGFTASNSNHYLVPSLTQWVEEEVERVSLLARLTDMGCYLMNTVACPSILNAQGELIDTLAIDDAGEEDAGEFIALKSKLADELPFRPGMDVTSTPI